MDSVAYQRIRSNLTRHRAIRQRELEDWTRRNPYGRGTTYRNRVGKLDELIAKLDDTWASAEVRDPWDKWDYEYRGILRELS